jgi:hypothetical protein
MLAVLIIPVHRLRTIAEPSAASKKPPTNAQRYESIRRTIESTVDPTWMKTNGKHLDFMIQRVVSGRCGLISPLAAAAHSPIHFVLFLSAHGPCIP